MITQEQFLIKTGTVGVDLEILPPNMPLVSFYTP